MKKIDHREHEEHERPRPESRLVRRRDSGLGRGEGGEVHRDENQHLPGLVYQALKHPHRGIPPRTTRPHPRLGRVVRGGDELAQARRRADSVCAHGSPNVPEEGEANHSHAKKNECPRSAGNAGPSGATEPIKDAKVFVVHIAPIHFGSFSGQD